MCKAACLLAALSLWAHQASALIIYGGKTGGAFDDAPANTTAPAGFEDAWARVGVNANGTGVYLGNGFVLTAAHVSFTPVFTVDGVDYDRIGTSTILTNPDESEADLRLFRIAVPDTTPLHGLGPLTVLDTSVATAFNPDDGVLIGTGVGQTSLTPINLIPEGGSGFGFAWDDSASRDKRWAVLEIGAPTSIPTILGRATAEGFKSTLNFGNDPDGSAANNDSGAPIFYDTGSEVVLAGLVHSVTNLDFSKQNEQTFSSDLAEYDDQIIITPGDLDGNGFVGPEDLDLVLDNFGQSVQAGNWLSGDADGDGQVGVKDLDYLLARWNNGTPPAVALAVPEPTSLILIAGAFAIAARRRRARSARCTTLH